jgi:hypothetical protein
MTIHVSQLQPGDYVEAVFALRKPERDTSGLYSPSGIPEHITFSGVAYEDPQHPGSLVLSGQYVRTEIGTPGGTLVRIISHTSKGAGA